MLTRDKNRYGLNFRRAKFFHGGKGVATNGNARRYALEQSHKNHGNSNISRHRHDDGCHGDDDAVWCPPVGRVGRCL